MYRIHPAAGAPRQGINAIVHKLSGHLDREVLVEVGLLNQQRVMRFLLLVREILRDD